MGRVILVEDSSRMPNCLRMCLANMVTYHLIANLVTLGFSARTFRLTRSMIGFAGGSALSSSLSYSLLT